MTAGSEGINWRIAPVYAYMSLVVWLWLTVILIAQRSRI